MKMIIDNPYIHTCNGYSFLNAKIYVGDYCGEVTYKVDEKYKEALNSKKSDAFEWDLPCIKKQKFACSCNYI